MSATVQRVAAATVAAAAFSMAAACQEARPEPLDVQVGTVEFDTETLAYVYVPLVDGDDIPLVRGLQGGSHFPLAVRARRDRPYAGVSLVATAESFSAGEELGWIEVERGLGDAIAVDDSSGATEVTWQFDLVVDARRVAAGEPVHVTVGVRAPDGGTGAAVVDLVAVVPDGTDGGGGEHRLPPLDLRVTTDPWFLIEPLPPGPSTCAALADVLGGPELEVVLAGEGTLRVVAYGPGGRAVIDTPIDRTNLDRAACTVADFDRDGIADVAVSGPTRSYLMRGLGDGTFEDVPDAFPTLDPDWEGDPLPANGPETSGLAVLDFDADGLPDLYAARSQSGGAALFEGDGCSVDSDGGLICGEDGVDYPGQPNVLYRNLGGRFEVVSRSGAEGTYQSLAVLTGDLDGDGALDVLVANDGARSRLYRGMGDGTFEDDTDRHGFVRGHGMGLALSDLDGDGFEDIFVSDIWAPMLLRGGPDGWAPASFPGVGASDQWQWGVASLDVDNDGDRDLLVAGGSQRTFRGEGGSDGGHAVGSFNDMLPPQYPITPLYVLYENDGTGAYTAWRATSFGPLAAGSSWALVAGDIDLDGRVDVVSTDIRSGEARVLWGARETVGNEVTVQAPIGARVRACVADACQVASVVGGSSFRSTASGRVRFGLASAVAARVEVTAGDGRWTDLGEVEAGTLVRWAGNP